MGCESREREAPLVPFLLVSAHHAQPGGKVSAARIALGGVATKPWRSREAEGALLGKPATHESFAAAASEAVREAHALPDNRFKLQLIQATIVRALERARDRT